MDLVDILAEQGKLILTGVFITFISSIVYRFTPTGFVSAGKFRTKEGAIAIYLFSAIMLGVFTPLIYGLSGFILEFVPIISIFGVLIFLANFIINQSVPSWKHTSPKTVLIYSISLILIIIGFFVNLNLF